jgi:hypothetical protein
MKKWFKAMVAVLAGTLSIEEVLRQETMLSQPHVEPEQKSGPVSEQQITVASPSAVFEDDGMWDFSTARAAFKTSAHRALYTPPARAGIISSDEPS